MLAGKTRSSWSPPSAKPWSFNVGYAFGSGDGGDLSGSTDHSFRQTGIQDNNGEFGGVTSFRYYGELFDPELSNMHILTLGIGRRFQRRYSADLVFHTYRQDKAFNRLRNAGLSKAPPNARSVDLGQELDLILGHRAKFGLDTEIVLAAFDPGAAFDNGRPAYLVKIQLRYRF